MKNSIKTFSLIKIFFLLCLSLMFISGIAFLNEIKITKGRKLKDVKDVNLITNPKLEWKLNYEITIEYLKKHEGFAKGKPYLCPGGYNTIGYGHLILSGENFDELTKKQADSLLRVDFNKALKEVDRNVKLSGLKKLAIAHFVFSKGIGTFLNSGLIDKIGKGESIDDLLIENCYYTNIEGLKIKSQNALNIRKWEICLYNLES